MHGMLVRHYKIAGFPHGRKGAVKTGIGQVNLYSGYNLSCKQPGKERFKYIHFSQPFR